MGHRTFTLLISFLLSAPALAQLPSNDDRSAESAKQLRTKVVEQIAAEVSGLRLAENRAFALSRAGAIVCKDDRETAQGMMRQATDELVAAQVAAETAERSRFSEGAANLVSDLRPRVLTAMAGCDAELALESLYRTRTPALQRDLATRPEMSSRMPDGTISGIRAAQNEFALEQRLLRMAAEQNPEIAAKVVQESIKRGLSAETLGMLKTLHTTNPDLAASLSKDTIDRLLGITFSQELGVRNELSLTVAILEDQLKPAKPGSRDLRFDDAQVRSLAARYISYAIGERSRRPAGINIHQATRFAEKYAPASVQALRRLAVENRSSGPGNMREDEVQRIIRSNATPANIIADAKRLAPEVRGPVYRSAAAKMAASGEYDTAAALLTQNFTGPPLEAAIEELNRHHAEALIRQGRWQEAENLIDRFPDESNRRRALIDLAKRAFAKDSEANRDLALGVLRRVRASFADRPTRSDHAEEFVRLTAAFAPIDPEEAFASMESLITVLNELADANAYVSAFNGNANVRQNEYTFRPSPSFGFYIQPATWQALVKADSDRTNKLIDRFARREIRIAMRFQLIDPLSDLGRR